VPNLLAQADRSADVCGARARRPTRAGCASWSTSSTGNELARAAADVASTVLRSSC
jgi:hypothetical protein